jgi:hypothetical protein
VSHGSEFEALRVNHDEAILERLDEIAALLVLAHGDAIEATRVRLRADPMTAAALDACADDWTPAKEVITSVQEETGAGRRTIQQRVAQLVASRVIQSRGATHTRAYRSRGLV